MLNKKKGGMMKRYQASYDSKESGGAGKKGVMNFRKLDQEVSFFKPIEGKNRINIIPYVIKTKNHPLVKRGEFEVGDKDYVMDFYVHRGVGPTESSVLCLKNTFGKPCPICEQQALFNKDGKEKEAKALKAQRRVIYNVEDLKEPGKVKVFETSHYLFEKELIDEARDDEEGGFIDFADPEEGKEIKFRASKESLGGHEYFEFKSFSFEDRDEPISEELLDQAISFDEIMEVPSYDEVQKILLGDDDEEDEEPKKSSKKSKHQDEEDEDEDDEEEPKKFKKIEKDEDDEDDEIPSKKLKSKSVSEEDSDDDELEEKPVKKSKSKPEPEEDEDDQEDEDEKPAKSSKKNCSGDCSECPFGHKFGKDTDNFDDCDDCEIWDKCCKAN